MTLHAGPMIHKNIIQCSTCGFCHWHPLPDASTVARYYEEDNFYSQHSPPDWFKKEEWEHSQGYWLAYYEYLASFLNGHKGVIDIGCGPGRFLYYLATNTEHWWKEDCLLGVEPSRAARLYSPVRHRLITDLDNINPVGNIVLMLTLEHILDPEAWLREEILPHLDGRLIIVVPNEFNRLQRWVGGDWFVSPVHLNYFTRDSLRGLLERAGLKVIHQGATFPTELWPLIGLDHRKNPDVGRRTHLWRLKLEKAIGPKIFKLYAWWFRRFNIGREIIMVAEWKKS